ncbi:asparagine synthetase B family protein [Thioalkalivibrio sp. AKL8]|uniref:asparagine synthase-related protein n=1 Tax=Thioalkalivibrio sp. AKL8 TaxID=1158156 RepID=UPI000373B1FC|nr:asparagine synthetase B family protein [Thioalkalivibrio sp. AKL8]
MNNVVTHWNNAGWESDPAEKVMVHGSAFHDGQLLRGGQLATVFSEADPGPETWQDVLSHCNGFFAIARQTPTATLVAVDRIRSIPVFYGQQGGTVFVSDDAEWVRQSVGDTEMEPLAREEFQLAGYVTGSDTLYPNVKQLQAGELLHIVAGEEPEIATHRWYRFTHTEPQQWDEGELRDELDKSAESSVRRLAEYAAGRQIVIPLSGGYDSRLIALLLKRIGYDNILTFTYGVPGNKESEYSRQVAEALSLPWHFVEYSGTKWSQAWQTDERLAYQRWASGWASLPHVQDWLAVRELKANGVVAADAVFCPGHGGSVAGGHIPDEFVPGSSASTADMVGAVIKKHVSLAPWRLVTRRPESEWRQRIIDRAESADIQTAEAAADAFEKWEWQERQAKFINNSVRVYEFYGFDWWLPLWDSEFMDFWGAAPLWVRCGKRWYTQYVKSVYAAASGSQPLDNASSTTHHGLRARLRYLPVYQSLRRRLGSGFPTRFFSVDDALAREGRYDKKQITRLKKMGYTFMGRSARIFLRES